MSAEFAAVVGMMLLVIFIESIIARTLLAKRVARLEKLACLAEEMHGNAMKLHLFQQESNEKVKMQLQAHHALIQALEFERDA